MNIEIQNALDFMGLEMNFTPDELKKKYHSLALRYHPDRGEFTSDVMFIQLLEYKNILEIYLESQIANAPIVESVEKESFKYTDGSKPQTDYSLYKSAKKIENEAILNYFQSRKKALQVELDPHKNPQLQVLIQKLQVAKLLYEKLISEFPDSIWIRDAKDSLESFKVWWKNISV